MSDTKSRLLSGAAETMRESGIAGLSARTIAARADVNQALIFYHFNTVAELVDAAVRASVDARVEFYRGRFAAVGALAALDALQRLGVLVEVMDDLGPVAHRALRRRVRRKGADRTKTRPLIGRRTDPAR